MNDVISHDIEKELLEITQQLISESGESLKRDIKLASSLQRHLGIDSLGRAELFQRVEKHFSVRLPDQLLAQAETLNDIAEYLKHPSTSIKQMPTQVIASHGKRSAVDPNSATTLLDLVLNYGELSRDKAHIYFQNEEGREEIITYGDLLTSALRVAKSLLNLGLKPRETVAIMQPTQPGFFYTFCGILLAGGIPVPIYPPFRMHMLEEYAKTEARILSNAEVRILVTFDAAENLSRLLKNFVPSLKHVTTVADIMQNKEFATPIALNENDPAFIQYTSGSTSDPKGVLLNHYNLLTNIRAYGKAIEVGPDDVAVSWLPLYHDMGLIGMWLGSLYYGIPLILLTPFSFLNHPERWLWAIHYHRGTLSGAPNFAYELCVRKIENSMIEGLDLTSWRMSANGAEKVYPRTLEAFTKKFAPYGFKRSTLMPVYGLAESTVALTVPPLGREFRVDYIDRKAFEEKKYARKIGEGNDTLAFVGCGMPILGQEIRIVDEEDNELPERHVGHLHFRGPSSMQGYFNNPAATRAIYHDGWWDSGDLAYLADQEVFITGRFKDLIIKAGRNIYPAEIEEAVGTVLGVRTGCVIAFSVSDKDRGTEQLVIVAETKEKTANGREKIRSAINAKVATALDIVPDQLVLVKPHTVPKTSSGKLQRALGKKMYLENRLEKLQIPPWLQVMRLGGLALNRKLSVYLGKLGKALYTCYFVTLGIITLIPLYVIVGCARRDFAARSVQFAARLLLKLSFCRVKIIGAANLTRGMPLIYAANHASYIDTLVTLALVPSQTRFIGKKELLSTPIIRTFIRKLDYLVVDRIDLPKGLEDTRHIEDTLKAGYPVLIFPEGTFGYAFGLRPFRLGAFKIATETNTPVCPIALQGTRVIFRDEEKLMKPGPITVVIGEPISPRGADWQAVTQLRNEVREQIAKYCGEPSLDYIAAKTVAVKRNAQ